MTALRTGHWRTHQCLAAEAAQSRSTLATQAAVAKLKNLILSAG